uniref:Secreted protein n=1 Tax=Setaria viridis TaxID=4556 RepID=A0A4U6TQR4_SETVI|nr:hypothetical protein SEVIR_7G042300v2 [Setaria viridis]TKW03008.1 hypothetical protein SEVIR_7G042300v2 [Setaria viridis]TKW03009.1 hypothetical protein SEVIR_7G042300v2 [Setaria viridis]TKW03010.1 hypothetical protein SEVIR_7G042300v2 [Setaria viridis]TKW03011.1 hypothetical protein SEVIR_7G042300v2 [Setaria viridis]
MPPQLLVLPHRLSLSLSLSLWVPYRQPPPLQRLGATPASRNSLAVEWAQLRQLARPGHDAGGGPKASLHLLPYASTPLQPMSRQFEAIKVVRCRQLGTARSERRWPDLSSLPPLLPLSLALSQTAVE